MHLLTFLVIYAHFTCLLRTTASPIIAHADARLNAPSAAGTRVNSDAESLLRYGLPIKNQGYSFIL